LSKTSSVALDLGDTLAGAGDPRIWDASVVGGAD
jgi:hypothetical protein